MARHQQVRERSPGFHHVVGQIESIVRAPVMDAQRRGKAPCRQFPSHTGPQQGIGIVQQAVAPVRGVRVTPEVAEQAAPVQAGGRGFHIVRVAAAHFGPQGRHPFRAVTAQQAQAGRLIADLGPYAGLPQPFFAYFSQPRLGLQGGQLPVIGRQRQHGGAGHVPGIHGQQQATLFRAGREQGRAQAGLGRVDNHEAQVFQRQGHVLLPLPAQQQASGPQVQPGRAADAQAPPAHDRPRGSASRRTRDRRPKRSTRYFSKRFNVVMPMP